MDFIGTYKGIRCYRTIGDEYKEGIPDRIYVDEEGNMIRDGRVFAILKGNGEVEELKRSKPYKSKEVKAEEVKNSKSKGEVEVLLDVAFEPWDVWAKIMKVKMEIEDFGDECE